MANPNGRKGADFETALAAFFNAEDTFGREVFRAPRWGAKDKGDLVNTLDFVIEAKNQKTLSLSGWLNEARAQAVNAKKRWGAVVIKKRNHAVRNSYVVMRLDDFSELLREFYKGAT